MEWSKIHSVISAVKMEDEKIFQKALHEAAPFRKKPTTEESALSKKAGVMLLLYPKNNQVFTVLIQRPEYEGHHSKQISLPGGKFESIDKDLTQTALRETEEEIGVPQNEISIIHNLSPIYIPPSNFFVQPSIGWIDKQPRFIREEREVDEIIEIPIAKIIKHGKLQNHEFSVGNGLTIKAPAFNIDNKIIWGATCLILNEFRWRILDKI